MWSSAAPPYTCAFSPEEQVGTAWPHTSTGIRMKKYMIEVGLRSQEVIETMLN